MLPRARLIAVSALLAAIGVLAAAGVSDVGPTYAIRNARIVPVSSPVIEKGTLIIRDGLIEALGPAEKTAIPEDAEIVEAEGLIAYPGLISAHTNLLLDDPSAAAGQRGTSGPTILPALAATRGAGTAAETSPGTPELMVLSQLKPAKAALDGFLRSGFTTVLIAPRGGIIQGQSVVVNLNGLETGPMVLSAPAALHINFTTNRGGGYPSSLMGTIAYVRQSFLDAGHYALAREVYARNLTGMKRPVHDPFLEALVPYVKDKKPVVFQCNNAEDIKRALKIIEEFKLTGILSHANEAWRDAAALKKAGVKLLVTLDFRPPNGSFYTSQGEDLRKKAEAEIYPSNPAALAKEGIAFGLTTFGLADAATAVRNVRTAIKLGLPEDVALRALTLLPAQVLGLERQVGSLEPGKIANIILAKGPLFDEKTQVDRVFVDGAAWKF
jgi:imidazolonepropionase-like amidohydrolase